MKPSRVLALLALFSSGLAAQTPPALPAVSSLNEAFANSIGADAYCRDAAVAVETAKSFMAKRQGSALAKA